MFIYIYIMEYNPILKLFVLIQNVYREIKIIAIKRTALEKYECYFGSINQIEPFGNENAKQMEMNCIIMKNV